MCIYIIVHGRVRVDTYILKNRHKTRAVAGFTDAQTQCGGEGYRG